MKVKFNDVKEKASWAEIPPDFGDISPDHLPTDHQHQIKLVKLIWSLLAGEPYRKHSVLNWYPGHEGDVVLQKLESGEILLKDVSTLHVLAQECFGRGVVYVREEIEQAYGRGEIKTAEDILTLVAERDDATRALFKQKDLWDEERRKRGEAELQLYKERDERRKRDILRDAPSEERERFTKIVNAAKRTKNGRVVLKDVEVRCRTGFPTGIAGRKVDDKYVLTLCKIWKISLK